MSESELTIYTKTIKHMLCTKSVQQFTDETTFDTVCDILDLIAEGGEL